MRFCPDIKRDEEWLVKNAYTNYKERVSFSIEIIMCDKDED